jgi:UDP:flavonoid glycosyltransferase YjiC (YdhE family)
MRIVLATFGSLGDLHPLIAVGLELRERGHEVVFATNLSHQERVTRHGFAFHALRPDVGPDDPATVAYLMDLKRGPERMLRELLFPSLREGGALTRGVRRQASGRHRLSGPFTRGARAS